MWLNAETYAHLKARADRAELAEARLKEIEDKREAERERHYSHAFQLTNQVLTACGRYGVKDEVRAPTETLAADGPKIEMSPEAEALFIEDYTEAGMDRDDAVAAFQEYQKTGVLPYEKTSEDHSH